MTQVWKQNSDPLKIHKLWIISKNFWFWKFRPFWYCTSRDPGVKFATNLHTCTPAIQCYFAKLEYGLAHIVFRWPASDLLFSGRGEPVHIGLQLPQKAKSFFQLFCRRAHPITDTAYQLSQQNFLEAFSTPWFLECWMGQEVLSSLKFNNTQMEWTRGWGIAQFFASLILLSTTQDLPEFSAGT